MYHNPLNGDYGYCCGELAHSDDPVTEGKCACHNNTQTEELDCSSGVCLTNCGCYEGY